MRLNPRLTCHSYLEPGSLGERGTRTRHVATRTLTNVCYSDKLDVHFYFILSINVSHLMKDNSLVKPIYSTWLTKHEHLNDDNLDSLFPHVAFNPTKVVWDFSVQFEFLCAA